MISVNKKSMVVKDNGNLISEVDYVYNFKNQFMAKMFIKLNIFCDRLNGRNITSEKSSNRFIGCYAHVFRYELEA